MELKFDFSKWWDIPTTDRQIGLESFDSINLISFGDLAVNVTIFNSWLVIALITLLSFLVTRNLQYGKEVSKRQIALEALV